MGIVSSAKYMACGYKKSIQMVSIPDGDSFLREGVANLARLVILNVSIPDGDSFLREVAADHTIRRD